MPSTRRPRRPNFSLARTTIERPSGVSSASEESCAASARSEAGTHAGREEEVRGLPVAERDRPGLVEQKHVDVARGLDGAAGHGEDVVLEHAIHAGDADRREEAADRRRDQADQERDEDGSRRHALRVERERPKRHGRDQEDDRQARRAGSRARSRSGVFCRVAPSTSAIIRSRNVSPGFDVISTTIRSERTRVPPVTADRSPPDSRMTGADSPVIADSSTEAMPSTTVPSPGDHLPRLDDDAVSLAQARRRDVLDLALPVEAPGDRLRASAAQRRRLGLPAALGHRLGEVREEKREPEPQRDLEVEQHVPAARRRRGRAGRVTNRAPTSTTNMTGFAAWTRGSSLRNESRDRRADDRAVEELGASGSRPRSSSSSEQVPLPGLHQEVLHDRAEREGGEEGQGAHDHDDADRAGR